jgi:gliding motility associated protien GldN
MKKIFISCVLVVLSVSVWAQNTKPNTTKKPLAKTEPIPAPVVIPPPPPAPAPVPAPKQQVRPIDGYFKKISIPQAKVMPLATIREADIIYSKRVWREIDVREKINQFFVAPQASLIEIIKRALEAGLIAYDPTPAPDKDDLNGDSFSSPLTVQDAMLRLVDSVAVPIIDPVTQDKIGENWVPGTFDSGKYEDYNFRIKEDWVFDKQRSVFEPRIIGIAVLKHKVVRDADGEVVQDLGYVPCFWLYFPELREILAISPVANSHNDAASLSYDDVFMKRIFSSYIVKVSNVKDQRIEDYVKTSGVDRLKEAERLKKELLDWEHDLWSY